METGYKLVSVSPALNVEYLQPIQSRRVLRTYTVVYEVDEAAAQEASDNSMELIELRRKTMTVPHVMVFRGDMDNKPDLCMAGIFGVPEGWKLGPEDKQPAPLPVLSPDFDITPLKAWFILKE